MIWVGCWFFIEFELNKGTSFVFVRMRRVEFDVLHFFVLEIVVFGDYDKKKKKNWIKFEEEMDK